MCLQIHTVFWTYGRIICQLLNVHGVNDVRQTEMHTAVPLLLEPSSFKVEIAMEKLKWHLRSTNLLILFGILNNYQSSGRNLLLYLFIKRVINHCSNYRGISLLPTTYKILSNILLSKLTSYVDQIIGDHQCEFWHNRSTTDQIFCICQILEKKWESVIL
jgi:hypothetical protein